MKTYAIALSVAVAAATAAPAAAKDSAAVSPEVIAKLEQELERSKDRMRVPGEPEPYFIAYKLTEVEVNDVTATLGATSTSRNRHFMNLDASVRVGDYDFDNSNFVIPRQETTDGLASIPLPLEATPAIAARSAWLATDAAFKEALEQYTAKKSNLSRRARARGEMPSYSKEPPTVQMEPVEVPPLEDQEGLEKLAAEVSAVFRDHAHIRESRVAYTSFLERRWYLNTEGTRAHDIRRVSGVVIVATTQAEDGEILPLYFSRYGHSIADLPGAAALKKEAQQMAKQLAALRTAPVLGSYTGPVLFEGAGAVDMVRHTLANELSGTPIPDGLPDEAHFGGAFTERIGLRVVSPMLTVADDPTATHANKHALIGGFAFDDEGVKARRVEVIKEGQLETLLMSRTPSAKITNSNGHARRQGPGMYHGSATNLFLQGKKGLSDRQLTRALLGEVKEQGLDHGLVIALWDDPMVTASGELSPLELVSELQGRKPEDVPAALIAYKVLPNGKRELVRGVQIVGPVSARAWRDVAAVGKDETVRNFLASSDDGVLLRFQGGGPGFVPSAGVESAIVTPDLLFEELDVKRNPASLIPEPIVEKP